MTVKELMGILQQCDQDMRVINHTYEGGYHDIPGVLIKNVWINAPWSVENEYVGPHDDCEDGDIENFKETYKEKYKKHVEKYGIPYKEKCLLIE